MRLIPILLISLLSGCDISRGLHVTVEPQYEGKTGCIVDHIRSIGLSAEFMDHNQLAVSNVSSGQLLFHVYPNLNDAMLIYYAGFGDPPSCDKIESSPSKVKDFLSLMQKHCNYHASSYEISMECRSNKGLQSTSLPLGD